MAVKKGYKQTEVGVIPDDWKVQTARNFSTIKTGPFGTLLKASEYCEYEGVPMISVGEIRDGYLAVTEKTPKIPADIVRRLPQFVLRTDDIVFGRKGGVDRSALITKDQDGWFLGSDGICVRPAVSMSARYIAFQFRSTFCQSSLLRNAIGTTMPSINQSILGSLSIPLPPSLPEQRAIAEALSDADAWIESLEQLIAKKRQIKQGAMQELLTGKKRLPGFEGKWEVKQLGECLSCRPTYGINASAVPYSDTLPPYIRITDITDDGRLSSVNRTSVKSSFADQYFLSDGDLVFARTGASVGKSYLYRLEDGPLVYAGFLIRVRPNASVLLPSYLACFVTTKHYWNWVRLMSMRSGQPGINGNEYAQMPVYLPSLAEQEAIAAVLYDMDSDIVALEARLSKARQIKQGMMQQLLTGHIRLVEPQETP